MLYFYAICFLERMSNTTRPFTNNTFSPNSSGYLPWVPTNPIKALPICDHATISRNNEKKHHYLCRMKTTNHSASYSFNIIFLVLFSLVLFANMSAYQYNFYFHRFVLYFLVMSFKYLFFPFVILRYIRVISW